ncbi:MAG: NUDIX domain-containing protein [Nanoarchaeota archaeon]
MEGFDKFNVIILGIIFDPKNKKVLIGRRENNPHIPELTWCFPRGRAIHGEDVDKTLKRNVKAKTGYKVKNLGTFFSETYLGEEDMIGIYFLTEVFEGKEKPGGNFIKLKWIHPKEIDKYFTTPIHKKLKEYLMNLV